MMMKVYVDTSVFGGCFDEEWMEWSNRLMEEFRAGRMIALISDVMVSELEEATPWVRDQVAELPAAAKSYVTLDAKAQELAERYIAERGLTYNMLNDAQHIAIATVQRAGVLVSWNFRHIVNLNRIRIFNSVNLRSGYPLLEIRTPREVLT